MKVVRYTVKAGGILMVLMGILMITGGMNKLTGYPFRSDIGRKHLRYRRGAAE